MRYQEAEERPKLLEELGHRLRYYATIAGEFRNQVSSFRVLYFYHMVFCWGSSAGRGFKLAFRWAAIYCYRSLHVSQYSKNLTQCVVSLVAWFFWMFSGQKRHYYKEWGLECGLILDLLKANLTSFRNVFFFQFFREQELCHGEKH